jgi:hypothetical protein
MKKLFALGLLLGCAAVQAAPADDVDCDKCVDAGDLSANAIAGRHLKTGVVSTDKIADKSVSQQKIGQKAITTGKIKNGAVTLSKLSPELAAAIARIDELEAYVEKLQAYIEVDETTTPSQPTVRVVGANLQVVNGLDRTTYMNGTGNVIIGYNDATGSSPEACSDGVLIDRWEDIEGPVDQAACEAAGETWGRYHRSGSHNLVIGRDHSYSQWGGLVAGEGNVINGSGTSVTGGWFNIASGDRSVISGGTGGKTLVFYSSIAGGADNIALAPNTVICGGQGNIASGRWSSVSGGRGNEATGLYSSISGGYTNVASGQTSSVSGGEDNAARGSATSVSGGYGRSANGTLDWAAGTLLQDF